MKTLLVILVIVLSLTVSTAFADVTMVAMKTEGQGIYIIWSSPVTVARYEVVNGSLQLVEVLSITNHPYISPVNSK
jgi:hypothetical protein